MRWYRYLPALFIGGALWATIYTTVGRVSLVAVGIAYNRWPVPTVVVGVLFVVGLAGWIIWRLTATKAPTAEKV